MSFIKNPFRKPVQAKTHPKPINPTINRATNSKDAQGNAQGAKPGASKKSLPNNYLDPNSVF